MRGGVGKSSGAGGGVDARGALISSMVESTIGNNCDKTTTHSISMSP
jgi:hypothetical protein